MSIKAINSIIYWLYRLSFADITAWSKPQVAPNSEDKEMMRYYSQTSYPRLNIEPAMPTAGYAYALIYNRSHTL
ncbi:MAG: hypothetical protein V7K47_25325 [Nostoc sp.]